MTDDRATEAREDALAALRARLLRAVRRNCPRRLADRAEDICQNALIQVTAVLERRAERPEALPSWYLKKAAYSATVDAIRSQRRRLEEGGLDDDALADIGSISAERRVEAGEIGRGIRDCLSRLTRLRRVAVWLHLQGHTLAESSRILGWPETRTTNLVYRGLRDLRACLGRKGLDP